MERISHLVRAQRGLPPWLRFAVGCWAVACVAGHSDKAQAANALVAAVVKFDIPPQLKGTAPSFERSLVSGLKAAGFTVINHKATNAKLGPTADFSNCESEACWTEAMRLTGATHLVQAVVQSDAASFSVAVSVVEGTSGASFAESLNCGETDPCPPIPMALERAAKSAGRKAKREAETNAVVVQNPERVKASEKAVESGEASETIVTASPLPALPVAPPPDEGGRKAIGWTAVGLGAVLSVTGLTYLLYFDGRGKDCVTTPSGAEACRNLYEDTSRGIFTGLLGVASLGVGAYFLLPRSHDQNSTAVSVGVNNVSLTGRF